MPIREYRCRSCDHQFEVLERGDDDAPTACPACEKGKVEQLFSVPGVRSDGTRDLAMRAAKKRDAQQAKDRIHERLRYEESHDRHGH